jgi:hypothetical protein
MSCASSHDECDRPTILQFPGGRVGTAAHRGFNRYLWGCAFEDIDVADLAREADCAGDLEDVERKLRLAVRHWDTLAERYGLQVIEAETARHITRGDITITGHADILASTGRGERVILDLKTGYVERDYSWQLYAYALMYGAEWVATIDVHSDSYDMQPAIDEGQFWQAVRSQIRLIGMQETPGEHCGLCPRQDECVTRRAVLERSISLFVAPDEHPLDIRAQIRFATPMVRQIKAAVEKFEKIRKHEIERNGPIPMGDGTELRVVEEPRDEIDAAKAWGLITSQLDDDEVNACLTVGKTKLLSAIKARQERGAKEAAAREFMKLLHQAQAVRQKSIKKVVQRKVQR